jgi:hypothetical protein
MFSFKTVFLVSLGAAIGYSYGYKDARIHDKTIVERTLDRLGGSARGKYDPNLDRKHDSAVR